MYNHCNTKLVLSLIKCFIKCSKAYNSIATLQIIHYFKDQEVCIIDPTNNAKICFKLINKINVWAESISYGKRIFVTGGKIIDDVYELNTKKRALVMRKHMKIRKYFHSLCLLPSYIYSIGGFSYNVIGYCEYYTVNSNTWAALPYLNTPRSGCAAFSFNRTFIYVCCGHDGEKNLNSIERLNILSPNKWELIMVDGLNGRNSLHGIQLNKDQAIIFGGCDDACVSDCLVLRMNSDKLNVVKIVKMFLASYFYSTSAPMLVNGNVYAIDCKQSICVFNGTKWAHIK